MTSTFHEPAESQLPTIAGEMGAGADVAEVEPFDMDGLPTVPNSPSGIRMQPARSAAPVRTAASPTVSGIPVVRVVRMGGSPAVGGACFGYGVYSPAVLQLLGMEPRTRDADDSVGLLGGMKTS